MYKLVIHVGTDIYDDAFEEPDEPYKNLKEQLDDYCFYLPENAPQSDRDKVAKYILKLIKESNGDGCDWIALFKWNGKDYINDEKLKLEQW